MRNANLWNTITCSRILGKYEDQKRHDRHLRELATMKPCVDTTEPKKFAFLKYRTNTRELQRNRANEIQLENRLLLQKMLEIDARPPMAKQPIKAEKSLHAQIQTRELDRITMENRLLLRRLERCKGTVDDPDFLRKKERKRQMLLREMGENSNRYRRDIQLRLPPTPRDRTVLRDYIDTPPRAIDEAIAHRFEQFKRNYTEHMQNHMFLPDEPNKLDQPSRITESSANKLMENIQRPPIGSTTI
ncbi:unnamed protein product [Amoebophrya sp. A25]|nr:unnamed protein product [Amoebophrya sp. A25]|eukprot:GSA25T00011547001.1